MNYHFVCFNGKFIEGEELRISPENRSFRYGDGLFETIRLHNNKLLWIEDHFSRLKMGMNILGFDSDLLQTEKIKAEALELAQKNGLNQGKIRLMVFRKDGGNYMPLTDEYDYLITLTPIQESGYVLNKQGWRLGLYNQMLKPLNQLSPLKSSNALLYVLAARYARQHNFDEVLMLNAHGRICEGTISNVFLVMPGGLMLTPSIKEGILPGVMRSVMLRLLRQNGFDVREQPIMKDELKKAEEIFLTNTIQGIRWILSYDDRRYYNKTSRNILQILSNEIAGLPEAEISQ